MKKWQFLNQVKGQFTVDKVIKALLANRGLKTKISRQEFLQPKPVNKLTVQDVGLNEKELKRTTSRIQKAIKNKEKAIIYGDYDADGICATAILWEALNRLGLQVMPFIPNRQEGYGLKNIRLQQFKEEKISLIITVDNGIVHNLQAKKAKALGLDLIITDHHLQGKKIPDAFSIIHTTKLAGCGVAYFLARFLEKNITGQTDFNRDLDLVVIGTIADVVPLIGPNRSLVKTGLDCFAGNKRPGLKALFSLSGLSLNDLSAWQIAFIVAPRLNASGRLEDPMQSLRLVCTRNRERAERLAWQIDGFNQERQKILEQTVLKARSLWLATDQKAKLVFVADKDFHEGIIGLVAGKLAEEFSRPAIVATFDQRTVKASARSIDGFNIVEAIRQHADLLSSHGGHPKAAGLALPIEAFEQFRQLIVAFANDRLRDRDLKPLLRVDLPLKLAQIDLDFYRQLSQLEPFGEGNPEPLFAAFDLEVVQAGLVGKDKNHLQLTVKQLDGLPIKAIGFNCGSFYPSLTRGTSVDIAFNLLRNDFAGRTSLQLKIRDIRFKKGDGKTKI